MNEILNTFGQTIKNARQAARLTQEDLAEQAGITTRYIMAIENENKQPSMKVLFKIIRTLKYLRIRSFFLKVNIQTTKKNTSSA